MLHNGKMKKSRAIRIILYFDNAVEFNDNFSIIINERSNRGKAE
jgi:hypothetical protein